MGHAYAVLGAGRQGTFAAYDLAVNGDADRVLLGDVRPGVARDAAKRANRLAGGNAVEAAKVDVTKLETVRDALRGVGVFVSAVPYTHNLLLAKRAIAAKVSMVDLGGHTGIVRRQHGLSPRAKKAGVSIVPDCGMGPGANVTLAVRAMSFLDAPREVHVYDGGLPQRPQSPWNYALTFHIGGLVNEYVGAATFLRDGKRVEVPALTEPEDVVVPKVGTLEARVTSGGLSTMPWTFEGKLRVLENKTLRFPGHWDRMKALQDLGLFSEKAVRVGRRSVVPREVFEALFEPQVTGGDPRDVAVIRVVARGLKKDELSSAIVELVDTYDEKTGFTAMERVTGGHAAIVAAMIARGDVPPGAYPVEDAVDHEAYVDEARDRGAIVTEGVEAVAPDRAA